MKNSLHNQRYMETLLKLKYYLQDSYKCYDFLGQDLKAGDVNAVVGQLLTISQEKAAQAFLNQIKLIKDMNSLVK